MVEGMRRGTGVLKGEPLWDDGQISCPTGPMPPAPLYLYVPCAEYKSHLLLISQKVHSPSL